MRSYHDCSYDGRSAGIRGGKRSDVTGSHGCQINIGIAVCPGVGCGSNGIGGAEAYSCSACCVTNNLTARLINLSGWVHRYGECLCRTVAGWPTTTVDKMRCNHYRGDNRSSTGVRSGKGRYIAGSDGTQVYAGCAVCPCIGSSSSCVYSAEVYCCCKRIVTNHLICRIIYLPGRIHSNGEGLWYSIAGWATTTVHKMRRYHNSSCGWCIGCIRGCKRSDITGSCSCQINIGIAVCPGIRCVTP